MQTVTIYTIGNVMEIDTDIQNLRQHIIDAIDDGYIAIETIKGTQMIINTMNVVAIEIADKE